MGHGQTFLLPVDFSSCGGSRTAVYTQHGAGLDRACRTLRFRGHSGGCYTSSLLTSKSMPALVPTASCISNSSGGQVATWLQGRATKQSHTCSGVRCTSSAHCKTVLPGQLQQLGQDVYGSSASVYIKPRHKSLPKDEKATKRYLVLLQQLITILSSTYFSWALAPQGQGILN